MTEEFMFNAPRYYAFDNPEVHLDEKSDSFFEVDHEAVEVKQEANMYEDITFEEVESSENVSNMQYYSPMCKTPEPDKLERASSIGSIPYEVTKDIKNEVNALSKNLENMKVDKPSKKPVRHASSENLTKKSSVNKGSTSKLTRYSSRENLNRLAQPKHKFSSLENLNKPFVSMAEAMNKFQRGTPERFRSKPNLSSSNSKLKPTVPQSPALKTKVRHRPNTAISSEEKERLEFEEAQNFKIRAHPVNKKALRGPVKAMPFDSKPVTIPEPFNLTAPPKKVVEATEEKRSFHSNPVPKNLHKKPHLPPAEPKKCTIPQTPTFMKNFKPPVRSISMEEMGEKKTNQKLQRTKPIPFSFEARDERAKQKKERRLKELEEEEKKAREFHAKPMPKKIYGSPGPKSRSNSSSSSIHKSADNLSQSEPQPKPFKARSPVVLYKPPFVPKYEDKTLTEIREFQLNSDVRALERKQFDEKIRKKQELLDKLKEQEEAERLRQEEEEIQMLRKKAEKKAQPIKKFKPLVIEPSNKVTEPISPNFMTTRLREANKENIH